MTDVLATDRSDGTVTLTLNRPASLNSLDTALKEALRDALAELTGDPDCRALVLAGAGRAFCVGQDLREHAETLAGDGTDPLATVREHYTPIAALLGGFPKPVVAAVRGTAAGAGAALALLSDFRVGGPTTTFLMAFAGVGLSADTGASWALPRLVGHAKATELLLLAEAVPAAEAARLGLLTRLESADEEVLASAQELAARLAAGPTVAYAQLKRQLAVGGGGTFAEALAAETEGQGICGATADHRDATAAFLRREKPVFHGR